MRWSHQPKDTAARDAGIAAAYIGGATVKEIAAKVRLTTTMVSRILKQEGVPVRDPSRKAELSAMCADGKTEEEMALALGVTKLAIHKRLWRMGLKARKHVPTRWEELAKNFEFESGCWIWKGKLNGQGYGQYRKGFRKPSLMAHRAVYEQLVGPIPPGLVIDHLCREPACVNPQHCDPVTQRENTLRGLKGPRDFCPEGHPFKGENLYAYGTTKLCRICRAAAMRRFYQKKRERNAQSS